ncbi:hypothetical protein ElyMa_002350900 [Elysia marginata]|uniref:Uncharacterized protein n=1 Tax=Elysia marginata TaxID=1093978 RepID=A0AAV4G8U8_9GAST|nr:hypothetical protein ElyMa_002350900 [Elysia marginata]
MHAPLLQAANQKASFFIMRSSSSIEKKKKTRCVATDQNILTWHNAVRFGSEFNLGLTKRITQIIQISTDGPNQYIHKGLNNEKIESYLNAKRKGDHYLGRYENTKVNLSTRKGNAAALNDLGRCRHLNRQAQKADTKDDKIEEFLSFRRKVC